MNNDLSIVVVKFHEELEGNSTKEKHGLHFEVHKSMCGLWVITDGGFISWSITFNFLPNAAFLIVMFRSDPER